MDKIYVLFIISAAISFILTPFVRKFAVKIGALDIPKSKRKIHKKPMPLLGGLAIFISFIITMIIKKGPISFEESGILIGATIIVCGGFIDDLYDLKPWQKVSFQVSAAICLMLFNVKIEILTNPLSTGNSFFGIGLVSIPVTILWIVGVTNAFNLIDGLDGLAAGVALISGGSIFVVSMLNGRTNAAYMTAILCGSIAGFLPFNFNPASIFMGDTGSQLLGFLLAAISIKGAVKSAAAFSIAVPLLALGIPIYDTIFAIIRRKLNGKPISQADRGHLHHRLLDMGLSQKQAVLIIYAISAVLGIVAIVATQINNRNSYFLLACVLCILVLLAWKFGLFKHRE